jgi:hypothetical protein
MSKPCESNIILTKSDTWLVSFYVHLSSIHIIYFIQPQTLYIYIWCSSLNNINSYTTFYRIDCDWIHNWWLLKFVGQHFVGHFGATFMTSMTLVPWVNMKAILAWNYWYKKYTNYQCIFIVVDVCVLLFCLLCWMHLLLLTFDNYWSSIKVGFGWLWISNGNYGGFVCSFVHGSHLDGLQICSKILYVW